MFSNYESPTEKAWLRLIEKLKPCYDIEKSLASWRCEKVQLETAQARTEEVSARELTRNENSRLEYLSDIIGFYNLFVQEMLQDDVPKVSYYKNLSMPESSGIKFAEGVELKKKFNLAFTREVLTGFWQQFLTTHLDACRATTDSPEKQFFLSIEGLLCDLYEVSEYDYAYYQQQVTEFGAANVVSPVSQRINECRGVVQNSAYPQAPADFIETYDANKAAEAAEAEEREEMLLHAFPKL